MTYLNIKRNELVEIEGVLYTFDRMLPPNGGNTAASPRLQLFDDQGAAFLICEDEFHRLYEAGTIRFGAQHIHANDRAADIGHLDDADDDHKNKKRRIRRHYVLAYDANPVSLSDGALHNVIKDAAPKLGFQHKPPSPGSLRRWTKARGEPGDRRALYMGDRHRHGPSEMRLEKIAEGILAEKANAHWDDRYTFQDVHDAVVKEINARNRRRAEEGLDAIKAPSYSTVRRYLMKTVSYANHRRRNGARAANQLYRPLRGSLEVAKILDKAIADSTVLDLFAIDEVTGEEIGRPTLTLIIDVKSRYPLGFYLGFEPPSLYTIMAALRMTLGRKQWINSKYPTINGTWVAWGRCRTLLVDNGMEYTGTSFADALADANINVEWAGVRNPQYKGICERAFGTIRTQFSSKLPGGIPYKRDVMQEMGLNPQGEAMLTLSQIEELLCHYFIEIYADRPHSTLKKSPRQAWLERLKIDGIEKVNDMKAFNLSFGTIVRDKQLTREGVKHRGLVYRSEEEFRLLDEGLGRQRQRGIRKGAVAIKLKEYPDDVSHVGVYDEARGNYVEFVCEMKRYPKGLSIRQHNFIKNSFGGGDEYTVSEEELCIRRERFRERVRSMIPAANITNRKRIARAEPAPLNEDQRTPHASGSFPNVGNPDDSQFEISISPNGNRSDGSFVEPSPRRGGKKAKTNGTQTPSKGTASNNPYVTDISPSRTTSSLGNYDISTLLLEAESLEGVK